MPVSLRLFFLYVMILLSLSLGGSAASLEMVRSKSEAVHSGSAAAAVLSNASPAIMELRAEFASSSSSRATWDIPLREDLSRCAALRLRFRCTGAEAASELMLHLHLGGGWYSTAVSPASPGLWEEVVISKSALMPEQGVCCSWRKCDKLRLTVWPGAAGSFRWQFAAIDFLEANTSLAILRGGMPEASAESRKSSALYARHLGNALVSGGVLPAVVDESDASLEVLRNYKCVLLPSAEALMPHTQKALAEYLKQGGRCGAFYTLPTSLGTAMAMPGGKFHKESFGGLTTTGGGSFAQRSTVCIAVDSSKLPAGCKVRAWWNDTAGRRSACPAIISSGRGFWMTHVYLNQEPARAVPVLMAFIEEWCAGARQKGAEELLRRARFALANAGKGTHVSSKGALSKVESRIAQKDYPGTLAAYRSFQSSLADEALGGIASGDLPETAWRAAWLNSPAGLAGSTWEQTAAKAAAARLNVLLPCFLTPYSAAYPSRYLPRAGGGAAAANGDVVSACLAAAARRRIAVHPWVKVLSVAEAPLETRKSLEAAGRLQCKRNGQSIPWLCPTNQANRELLKKILTEMVTKYHFAGVHLDMIRYSGSEYCYCAHCRKAFEASRGGKALKNWPECIAESAALQAAWAQFRRNQITGLLKELAAAIRGADRTVQLSAAVYPDAANARNAVGQDWVSWVHDGTCDFVCPMSYRATAALFQGDVSRAMDSLGGVGASRGHLRPGIGLSSCALERDQVERQILTVRKAGLDGYAIFEFSPTAAAMLAK